MPYQKPLRLLVLLLLATVILTALTLLFTTDAGRQALRDPHALGQSFRSWVRANPVTAPLAFVAIYVTLALALIPLWWLQILAGYGFGLVPGVLLGQVSTTCAASVTVALSHWLTADYVHDNLERHMARLRRLDEALGSNGLLVVIAIRMTHFIPFAVSNYFLGLTRVSVRDTAVGTFLGGIPAMTFYVALGANRHLLTRWEFWTALTTLTVLLLLPLLLRYLIPAVKPDPTTDTKTP